MFDIKKEAKRNEQLKAFTTVSYWMVKWHKKAYHHDNEKDLEVARNKDGKQNVYVPA